MPMNVLLCVVAISTIHHLRTRLAANRPKLGDRASTLFQNVFSVVRSTARVRTPFRHARNAMCAEMSKSFGRPHHPASHRVISCKLQLRADTLMSVEQVRRRTSLGCSARTVVLMSQRNHRLLRREQQRRASNHHRCRQSREQLSRPCVPLLHRLRRELNLR